MSDEEVVRLVGEIRVQEARTVPEDREGKGQGRAEMIKKKGETGDQGPTKHTHRERNCK